MHSYNDCLQYIPDLKKYVKSKVTTDIWKDIVQDTLLYLHFKFDTLQITDLKGLILNTANFFIQKYYTFKLKDKLMVVEKLENIESHKTVTINCDLKIGKYNSFFIDDNLLKNLDIVSETLFTPFQMQLNGFSIKDIAEELKCNENTVKTRISRCKEKLKTGL